MIEASGNDSSVSSVVVKALDAIVLATMLSIVVATLFVVGQPIFANDTWIHLALGEAFASAGPWLEADPYLFAAPGPPSPASWLGAWTLFEVFDWTGFAGLRLAHVGLVLGALFLVWRLFRQSHFERRGAAVGVLLFIALSTYRLVQLRPDLFTILATLGVISGLMLRPDRLGRREFLMAAALGAVWANWHAGFVLGPILLLGTSAALLLDRVVLRRPASAEDTGENAAANASGATDALGLASAGLAMVVGSLLNPQGVGAWLAYFESGGDTLPLGAVVDEWGRTNLLAAPVNALPPTWAAWGLCWLALLVTAAAFVVFLHDRSSNEEGRRAGESVIDPRRLALAVACLVAAIWAQRFLWLAVVPFTLVGDLLRWRGHRSAAPGMRTRAGLALVLVVAISSAHFRAGDWVLVTRGTPRTLAGMAEPYTASKFFASAMWFLADTGVEGRIFNDYPLGGFMSFWLAPELQMSSSGTMNVDRTAMEDFLAIAAREGRNGASFEALLDRHEIDLFLGIGLPTEAAPGRAVASTVRHLAGVSGWRLVYRNLRSAIYLRANARNESNLARIASWYAEQGVPFDAERGFDVERVITRTPDWAIAQGIIPRDFKPLLASVRHAFATGQVGAEPSRLAAIFSTLGLCDRALSTDRRVLELAPGDLYARHRTVWCLLDAGRFEAARREVDRWTASAAVGGEVDPSGWKEILQELAPLSESERRARIVRLALMPIQFARFVRLGFVLPPARTER